MSGSLQIAAATCNLLLGGATTFLLNLTAGFRSMGVPLRIVGITNQNEHEADFNNLHADLHVLQSRRKIYEDRLQWGYERIAEVQPHALLACLGAESFEMLRLAPPGTARIALIQADSPEPYALAQNFSPWIDTLVGVSNTIRDRAKSLPEFAGKNVIAIPYGIDFSPRIGTRGARGSSELRVLYLGRLIEEQKRISRLAEVIRIADQKKLPMRFSIIGSGPDAQSFQEKIAPYSNVRMFPPVANRDVPGVFAEHDVFILLSDYEGLPLSLLEAMGHGLVPVISDLPSGVRDVVTPDCGMLVPIGDIQAVLTALETLAANHNLLASMASSSERTIRATYSAQAMASNYLDLITSLQPNCPRWPLRPTIPTPLGLSPLVYNGIGRVIRRFAKRFVPART